MARHMLLVCYFAFFFFFFFFLFSFILLFFFCLFVLLLFCLFVCFVWVFCVVVVFCFFFVFFFFLLFFFVVVVVFILKPLYFYLQSSICLPQYYVYKLFLYNHSSLPQRFDNLPYSTAFLQSNICLLQLFFVCASVVSY